jgi:hypothetical protein
MQTFTTIIAAVVIAIATILADRWLSTRWAVVVLCVGLLILSYLHRKELEPIFEYCRDWSITNRSMAILGFCLVGALSGLAIGYWATTGKIKHNVELPPPSPKPITKSVGKPPAADLPPTNRRSIAPPHTVTAKPAAEPNISQPAPMIAVAGYPKNRDLCLRVSVVVEQLQARYHEFSAKVAPLEGQLNAPFDTGINRSTVQARKDQIEKDYIDSNEELFLEANDLYGLLQKRLQLKGRSGPLFIPGLGPLYTRDFDRNAEKLKALAKQLCPDVAQP